ncbi:hypothetical protein [Agrobacterium tumefaciens]|uniref:hypothetical protein n=1 Tax=Agrobacterium tumefaciens TaxID=358 RepID=UPI0015718C91|nr:hypothetical protein [Agrobacterium tumefaciens]NTB01586.1 hypothetical protein [Agrobacterium tumefaciens]
MTALEEIKKALAAVEQFIVNGVELGYIRMPNPETPDSAHDTLPMIRNAQTALERLQSENEAMRERMKAPEPELTCPHIDKLVQSGELSIEAIQELERIRDINSMLRYGLWHEKARAEAAEAEVKRYRAALSEIATNDGYRILTAEEVQIVAQKAIASTGGEHHGN